jgi:hypothetical protein
VAEERELEGVRLDSQAVDSINEAVNMIALQVPGPAAIALALNSAVAVDSFIAGIGEELADRITAAGFERYLRRSLHRREHIRKILRVLDAQTAKLNKLQPSRQQHPRAKVVLRRIMLAEFVGPA